MPSPSRPAFIIIGFATVFLALILQLLYNPAMAPARLTPSSLQRILQRLPSRAAIRFQSPIVYRTSTTLLPQSPSKQTTHSFSTNNRMASTPFFDAVKARRTYYALNKEAPISDDKIVELVNDTVLHAPSSFNSQSTRVVVLLKKDHDQFWEFVKEVLKPMMPADQFKGTEQKLDGFKAGYGTVSDIPSLNFL
jgi:hypothetical protein